VEIFKEGIILQTIHHKRNYSPVADYGSSMQVGVRKKLLLY